MRDVLKKITPLMAERYWNLRKWYEKNYRNRFSIPGDLWPGWHDRLFREYLEEIGCSCTTHSDAAIKLLQRSPTHKIREILGISKGEFFIMEHPFHRNGLITIPKDTGIRAAVLGEFPLGPKTLRLMEMGEK
jgi:hypothetical protein